MSLQVSAEGAPPATFPAFVLVESTETGYPRLVSYRRWQQHGKQAGWQPHRDAGRFHTAHLTADYRATPTGADNQSYRVVIHYWQHLWLEAGRIAYQVSGNTITPLYQQAWRVDVLLRTVILGLLSLGLVGFLLLRGLRRFGGAWPTQPWALLLASWRCSFWVKQVPVPLPVECMTASRPGHRFRCTAGQGAARAIVPDRSRRPGRAGPWQIVLCLGFGWQGGLVRCLALVIFPAGLLIAAIQSRYALVTPWGDRPQALVWAGLGLAMAGLGIAGAWHLWRRLRLAPTAALWARLEAAFEPFVVAPPAKSRRRGLPGFSLTELIIVTAMIGILAAIAISPEPGQYLVRTRIQHVLDTTRPLREAIRDYAIQTEGRLPSDSQALISLLKPAVYGPAIEAITTAETDPHGPISSIRIGTGGIIAVTFPAGEGPLAGRTWQIKPLTTRTGLSWDYCTGRPAGVVYLAAACAGDAATLLSLAHRQAVPFKNEVATFVEAHGRLPRFAELTPPALHPEGPGTRHITALSFERLPQRQPDWGIRVDFATSAETSPELAGQAMLLQPALDNGILGWHPCHSETAAWITQRRHCQLHLPWLAPAF